MKYVILFFLFFVSCKKDCMISVPVNSIIRVGENYTYGCNGDKQKCLPVYNTDDIRFQLITDSVIKDQRIVLIPSVDGDITVEEVIQGSVGITQEITASGSFGGNLVLQFADFAGMNFSVGDNVFFSGACASGGFEYPAGYYQIISIPFGDRIDIGLTYNGAISNPECGAGCISNFKSGYLQSQEYTEINGEYVWNISPLFNGLEIEDGKCFQFYIYSVIAEQTVGCLWNVSSINLLGQTNCFIKIAQKCHTLKLRYQFDENSMGFYAGYEQGARINAKLNRPQYPGEEKGYQKSDGSFKKLRERVNKEWLLETDYLTDDLHKNIRMALSADTLQIWSENQTVQGAYRSESYDIEWSEDIDYRIAKAKTKISKNLLVSSVNSNCV